MTDTKKVEVFASHEFRVNTGNMGLGKDGQVVVPEGRSFVDAEVAAHPYAKHYLQPIPTASSDETGELLAMAQGEVDAARRALAMAQGEVDAARRALADVMAERDEARDQLQAVNDALSMDPDAAATEVVALQSQVVDLQKQLDAAIKAAQKPARR